MENCFATLNSAFFSDGREVITGLPMEFAVEAQKLLSVSMEGCVG